MSKTNKILIIIMIIIFPLGIIYCLGKNLFTGNFASFLGGVLLFVIGFILAIFLFRQDLVEPIFNFLNAIKGV